LPRPARFNHAETVERARPKTSAISAAVIKKLGRFGVAGKRAVGKRHASRGYGWEYCHVCIDDATRLAYVEVLSDERGKTAVAFLRRALAWFAERGVKVERVMTDNGSPYVSAVHAAACRELGIRHLRTRPYRPQTNGKNRALHPDDVARVGLWASLRQLD
jgi:transposase InsO family protein